MKYSIHNKTLFLPIIVQYISQWNKFGTIVISITETTDSSTDYLPSDAPVHQLVGGSCYQFVFTILLGGLIMFLWYSHFTFAFSLSISDKETALYLQV